MWLALTLWGVNTQPAHREKTPLSQGGYLFTCTDTDELIPWLLRGKHVPIPLFSYISYEYNMYFIEFVLD